MSVNVNILSLILLFNEIRNPDKNSVLNMPIFKLSDGGTVHNEESTLSSINFDMDKIICDTLIKVSTLRIPLFYIWHIFLMFDCENRLGMGRERMKMIER